MKRNHIFILSVALIVFVVLIPPGSFSAPFSQTQQECEECHSEFEAFRVIIDSPREVPEDYEFEYRVIVRNDGEHEVRDLEAVIDLSEAPNLIPAMGGREPYHEEISGSVSVGGTATFKFPVLEGATEAVVILDGEEGLIGMNDLDMTVTGPNGDSKSSADSGADEAVKLNLREISRWGYGEYSIEVVWFVGSPSISFILTIDVEYGVDQIYLKGEDLAPGGKFTFVLPIKSTTKGENIVDVAVKGTAHYEHGENDDPLTSDNHDYTIEGSSGVLIGDKLVYEPPDEDFQGSIGILVWERVFGLLSGLLLLISVGFSGLIKPVSTIAEKIVGGAAKRVKWHCRVSLILIIFSLIHGVMLPYSPHASSLRGLVPGTLAMICFGILGYIGWQQKPLKKRWGVENWRRLHLILTIAVVVIVLVHAIMDGSDFAWLR
ncbi:MAG: ferric reductase-like transmembrane domain-containing protein [Thermoplasmata archaeon]|nr:MAG: ferric reductase-like transmembrane domain-containing protein [Thermoplasmata archaeon]